VSGLAQHLESGACDGGKGTFRRLVEYVQEEIRQKSWSAYVIRKASLAGYGLLNKAQLKRGRQRAFL
jgi:hypothetical protein